jgi:hypothetical protein
VEPRGPLGPAAIVLNHKAGAGPARPES